MSKKQLLTQGLGDIFKNKFLEGVENNNADIDTIIITIGITLALSLIIFIVYMLTFQGTVYTHSYNVSLVIISLITCLIIMTISSNIVLSLGMVGALSIVRFRTTIKDPLDMIYMFLSISLGIMTGAGAYLMAIFGTISICIILVILMLVKTSFKKTMLVIQFNNSAYGLVEEKLNTTTHKIKNQTIFDNKTELTIDIKFFKNINNFVYELNAIEDVNTVSLVNYNE